MAPHVYQYQNQVDLVELGAPLPVYGKLEQQATLGSWCAGDQPMMDINVEFGQRKISAESNEDSFENPFASKSMINEFDYDEFASQSIIDPPKRLSPGLEARYANQRLPSLIQNPSLYSSPQIPLQQFYPPFMMQYPMPQLVQ